MSTDSIGVSFALLEDSPVGPVAVWATRNGIRRIGFVDREFVEEHADDVSEDPHVLRAIEQLRAYFETGDPDFDLELDLSGATDFQRQIYRRLMKIPCGRVASYGDLADELGEPGAARAVGQAVGANPLPVVIPCHRVVRSDRRLGGFSGGLERKVTLLQLEGIHVDGPRESSKVQPEVLQLPL